MKRAHRIELAVADGIQMLSLVGALGAMIVVFIMLVMDVDLYAPADDCPADPALLVCAEVWDLWTAEESP